LTKDIKSFAPLAKKSAISILNEVKAEMFGVDRIIRLIMVALYTDGHVLMEGNPGLGKTELVKTIAKVLNLKFGRIQFTPDLMPADITGTYMPDFNEKNQRILKFSKGPIFTSLLLADEINRATPKTQSAMLEAMAEKQVTVLGETYKLEKPFVVLATQNPIDQEGTYNLPEAQADRFMFKTLMPIPQSDDLYKILIKRTENLSMDVNKNDAGDKNHKKFQDNPLKQYEEINTHIKEVKTISIIEKHIINMFLASNRIFKELNDIGYKKKDRLENIVNESIIFGLSPRAAIDLMLATKAWSLLFIPDAITTDYRALANIVIPTLRHRIKLDIDVLSEDYYDEISNKNNQSGYGSFEKFLIEFCMLTIPEKGYPKDFKNIIQNAF